MIAVATSETPTSLAATRDYVSYSALSTYQQCPLRYYFRYVAGLPEETISASLVFGSAIHAAVELHFQEMLASGRPPSLDALTRTNESAARIQVGRDDAPLEGLRSAG